LCASSASANAARLQHPSHPCTSIQSCHFDVDSDRTGCPMPCGQIISTRPSKRSTVGHSRLMSAFVLAAVIRLLATFWSTRPDLNRHLQDRSLSLCPLNYAPKVATTDGFEPSLSESESDVLPLNDVATSCGRRGRSRTLRRPDSESSVCIPSARRLTWRPW
jgi:hypothetical protein